MADNLMVSSDDIEPPHLFDAHVLHNAKYNIKQESYLHKNPIKALEIMRLGSLKNTIHNIGLNPFFIHYWSNYQLSVYKSYATDETASVYIDATGSIIKKIKRPDKSKTGHIFIQLCCKFKERWTFSCVANVV